MGLSHASSIDAHESLMLIVCKKDRYPDRYNALRIFLDDDVAAHRNSNHPHRKFSLPASEKLSVSPASSYFLIWYLHPVGLKLDSSPNTWP
jgi:hypothetical protein